MEGYLRIFFGARNAPENLTIGIFRKNTGDIVGRNRSGYSLETFRSTQRLSFAFNTPQVSSKGHLAVRKHVARFFLVRKFPWFGA